MDMGHWAAANTNAAPTIAVTAEAAGAFGTGKPVVVTLHINDAATGATMDPGGFELTHTKTIHALGIDPSLTDYGHSHPQSMATRGDWTYTFTPKYDRPYHVWLDVKPVGGVQQYVMLVLNPHGAGAPVDTSRTLSAAVGDVTASLTFDGPLVAGQPAMGHLAIRRDGKPFAALEPVMGAYAHIVGISGDWRTIAHVHPMGAEPKHPDDRGGPAIDFHIEPRQAGFLKLFAQIQVDGRDVFLPFGVTVEPPSSKTSGSKP